jgi:acetylornithine/succinyldiaminopimelate/putrescine aminotransferase
MLKVFTLIIFILSSTTFAFASSTYSINKSSCAKVDSKISNINSQMRAGYSAQQGERLRDDLRGLKKQRDKCKKKKHSTSE